MGEGINLKQVNKELGVKEKTLLYWAEKGTIIIKEGCISKSDYEMIKKQKNQYVTLKDMMIGFSNERFNGKNRSHRSKLYDYLDDNNFFGVEILNSDKIYFDIPKLDEYYIQKKSIKYIHKECALFLFDFGKTEEELVNEILNSKFKSQFNCNIVKDFMKRKNYIYSKSLVDFVEMVSLLDDVKMLPRGQMQKTLNCVGKTKTTKNIFADFCKYLSDIQGITIGKVVKEQKRIRENRSSAYSSRQMIELAECIFNEKYIVEHKLVERAIDNNIYAELWMYISIYYICGWRPISIANCWMYPELKGKEDLFELNLSTLKDDILQRNITNEQYSSITKYVLQKIKNKHFLPSKTGAFDPNQLEAVVMPQLQPFFGRLLLISEIHFYKNGEGRIKYNRLYRYRNWTTLKEFFGDRITKVLGEKNLHSLRLTKSYEQGVEYAGRAEGINGITTHNIAAYIRNHKGSNMISVYLEDNNFTGLTAEVVMQLMIQRGVFSSYIYTALLIAYPEVISKLDEYEKTELIKLMRVPTYLLEIQTTEGYASLIATQEFCKGNYDQTTNILKTMMNIGMDIGAAKESGSNCIRRAGGKVCINPTTNTCIGCPHHVLTREAIPSIINVLYEYYTEGKSGNIRCQKLFDMMIKRFKVIIQTLKEDLTKEQVEEFDNRLEDLLNAKQSTLE